MELTLSIRIQHPDELAAALSFVRDWTSEDDGLGPTGEWHSDDVLQARAVCEGSIGFGDNGCAPRILDFWMDRPDQPTNMIEVAEAVEAKNWQSVSSTIRVFKRLAQQVDRDEPWIYGSDRLTYMPAATAEAFRGARDRLRGEGTWPSA